MKICCMFLQEAERTSQFSNITKIRVAGIVKTFD